MAIFHKDTYDTQSLLATLSHILIGATDTEDLLRQVAELLQTTFEAEFAMVVVKEITGHPQRIVAYPQRDLAFERALRLRQLAASQPTIIVETSNLPNDQVELKGLLMDLEAALLLRLDATIAGSIDHLGYVLLGSNKAGQYDSRDLDALGQIVGQLVVAAQNALHLEEFQNFSSTLQTQVMSAMRELRRSNEQLRELDATKDDFISMASHQLRTPLTSIKGYLSMLLDGDAGILTEQQKQMAQQAFVSTQRMNYLISDMLNLSRINTGKFVIEPGPVNLAELVQDEYMQLLSTAKTRGVTLTYQKPVSFPTLPLDETKTRQAVMNMIDNALYYTPQGGTVMVALTEAPDAVEFRVHDTGIGVPKADRPKLFTRFYRAKNARQVRPDGTGIGLFMAKKVVVTQGGSIIFESTEGQGSTFGFRLPKPTA